METIAFGALELELKKLELKQPNAAPTKVVLDLGCGEGRHSHAAAWRWENSTVIGVDLNASDVKTAQQKGQHFFESFGRSSAHLHFLQANGLRLPLPDASVDCVICSEVLEHIPDYATMLAELDRVLKPGGIAAISVPRYWPERICWALSKAYHQVEGGHIRIFKTHALEATFTRLGFVQKSRYYAHALHSPYWWLRCLFWRWGENAWPCKLYHRLLVWDLMQKPRITRLLETLLNPIMGKSVVWHWQKSTDA